MHREHYDAIVFGTGPTGVQTLVNLARRGWRVLALAAGSGLTNLYLHSQGVQVEEAPDSQNKGWAVRPAPLDKIEVSAAELSGWRRRGQKWMLELDGQPVSCDWWLESLAGPLSAARPWPRENRVELEVERSDYRVSRQETSPQLEFSAQGWSLWLPEQQRLCFTGLPGARPAGEGLELVARQKLGLRWPLAGPGFAFTDQAAAALPLFTPRAFPVELASCLARALRAHGQGQPLKVAEYQYLSALRYQQALETQREWEAEKTAPGPYRDTLPVASADFELFVDPSLNFDCHACGKCCSGWCIPVEEEIRPALREFYMTLPVRPAAEPYFENAEGKTQVSHTDQGCVFLNQDNLCSIHADLDPEKKPLACKIFPFLFVRSPGGVTALTSFYCSAVQRNSGRSLQVHQARVQQLAQQYLKEVEPLEIKLLPGVEVTTGYYQRLLDQILQAESLSEILPLATSSVTLDLQDGRLTPTINKQTPRPVAPRRLALALLENSSGIESEDLPAADTALLRLPSFDWETTPDELKKLPLWQGFEEKLDFYLRARLRNHGLLHDGDVLESLVLFSSLEYLLADLTRLYTRAAAEPPAEKHYFKALERVEAALVLHGRREDLVELALVALLDESLRAETASTAT